MAAVVVGGSRADGNPLERILAAATLPAGVGELVARRKGGQLIPIGVSASEVTLNGQVCYILTVRDVTIRRRTEETIRNLAYHDPLTGLPNRRLLNDRLNQAIERHVATGGNSR